MSETSTSSLATPIAGLHAKVGGSARGKHSGLLGRASLCRIAICAFVAATQPGSGRAEAVVSRPASAFLSSIAINTHTAWRDSSYATPDGVGDVRKVQRMLAYLGINRIRDSAGWPWQLAEFATLARAGIRLNLIVGVEKGGPTLVQQVGPLAELAPFLDGIEGPNEPDLSGVSFGELSGPEATRAIQARLRQLVLASPALAKVPVVQTSIGHFENYPNYRDMGQADIANSHSYYFDFNAPIASVVPSRLALARQITPGRPVIVTETGWPTRGGPGGFVDETAQSVLLLDVILDHFMSEVPVTYLYQLIDQPKSNDYYGLFETSGVPKPSGRAIHALTTILRIAGLSDVHTEAASVEVDGLPATAHSLMLTRDSEGALLVLWNEPPVWNVEQARTLVQPEVATSVHAPGFSHACVYDVLRGGAPESVPAVGDTFPVKLPARAIVIGLVRGPQACAMIDVAP